MKHQNALSDVSLLQRWPDPLLSEMFRKLLSIYEDLCWQNLQNSNDRKLALSNGYKQLCRLIVASCGANEFVSSNNATSNRAFVQSTVLAIRRRYGNEWLQSIASLLAMLMHFTPDGNGDRLLVNNRRPQKMSSTYPNSPAVAKYLGSSVTERLLTREVPPGCNNFRQAERYAERALNFRILDPSMESGQLLLAAALSIVNFVHRSHSPSSKEARYLTHSLLRKLCADCLWGIDRNELAVTAVRAIFVMLGTEFGFDRLLIRNLMTADALQVGENTLPQFDAVANNPPWGERLNSPDRVRLRKQFRVLEHWSDTYIAFGEMAIQCLRSNGVFGLILPSQLLATRNAMRLRELFMRQTSIERMILLPHSAFAHAKVRGLILIGRAKPELAKRSNNCLITVYPIVRRSESIGHARSIAIKLSDSNPAKGQSWLSLINLPTSIGGSGATLPLGQIADLASGVKLYERGAGTPRQTSRIIRRRVFTLQAPTRETVPAIRGRDLRDFHLGEPKQFVKFGPWLAWIGAHEQLRQRKRIFMRELCRSDGKITAAVARDGFVPLHGVLTIIPKGINANVLTGILNSATTAEYVLRHAASMSKVDFQRVTIAELRLMPVPVASLNSRHRSLLGLNPPTTTEASLRQRLLTLVRKLSNGAADETTTENRRAELDMVVRLMYEQ
jgi:hypothetical protein